MAQVNPENSTSMPVVSTRRRFLSNAAGIAGGTVLALATVSPALAAAAPATPLNGENASPALRAAARALDDANERLKTALAANDSAYAKADAWQDENPEPASKR